ncbi:MAG: hypothetical protein IPP71_18900 [Bacteroidetes bacterium]|nr:hypothetical protein [Bacteroidota bacterium]
MKKIYIILAFLFCSYFVSNGQGSIAAMQYTVGIGTGDLKDFISKASFRGATFDYRKMYMDKHVGIGFELGWSAYYEENNYATYTNGTESISGKQFRYCSTVPVLISANYYLSPLKNINPFAGIGIGTEFSRSDLDMGVFTIQTDTWHFAVKPELGVIIKYGPGAGVIVSGKYYNAFKTSEQGTRSYIAANVGLVWEY